MKLPYSLPIALGLGLLSFSLSNSTIAADEKVEVQSGQSVNPITKSVTKKKKYKHAKTLSNGAKSEVNETQTHKTMKDGTTDTQVERETKIKPAE